MYLRSEGGKGQGVVLELFRGYWCVHHEVISKLYLSSITSHRSWPGVKCMVKEPDLDWCGTLTLNMGKSFSNCDALGLLVNPYADSFPVLSIPYRYTSSACVASKDGRQHLLVTYRSEPVLVRRNAFRNCDDSADPCRHAKVNALILNTSAFRTHCSFSSSASSQLARSYFPTEPLFFFKAR